MSGLAGVICQKGFESDHIQKMTDIIKYRVPEDEGFILLDDKNLLHS